MHIHRYKRAPQIHISHVSLLFHCSCSTAVTIRWHRRDTPHLYNYCSGLRQSLASYYKITGSRVLFFTHLQKDMFRIIFHYSIWYNLNCGQIVSCYRTKHPRTRTLNVIVIYKNIHQLIRCSQTSTPSCNFLLHYVSVTCCRLYDAIYYKSLIIT